MEYIILIVVLAVLIVGIGGTMLLRPGRGRLGRRRGGGDVGQGTGTGTIERGTTTDGGTQAGGSASGATTTTVPPPASSRVSRAAEAGHREAAALGRADGAAAGPARQVADQVSASALLSLLSRDRLDDDTWDEIEEVLITADVGVTPARQIVEDLKTRVKVEGTRTPDEVREMLSDRAARPGGDRARAGRCGRSGTRAAPRSSSWSASTARARRPRCGKLARAR